MWEAGQLMGTVELASWAREMINQCRIGREDTNAQNPEMSGFPLVIR